jgi:sugar lactone lactonase YvrE
MLEAVGRLYRSGLILLASCAAGMAQQYSISTIAGAAPPATPASAVSLSIGQPVRVTTDSAGNFYFSSLNSVFKVSSGGTLNLVAGTSHAGFSGDGGPAVNAQLNSPQGLALDSKGNLYIADAGNNRVRVVSAAGIIGTFAGNGQTGASLPGQPASPPTPSLGDGGPATQANLHLPSGVAVDAGGNVYIADTSNNSIRKVYTDGTITTIAGDTYAGYRGDAGYPDPVPTTPVSSQAKLAEFRTPEDVAVDSSGNIYIADTGNGLIRKITTDGNINFIAGNSTATVGYFGDGGLANVAGLVSPFAVAVDPGGNVYEVEPDVLGGRLRKIDITTGQINSIAGNRPNGFAGDSGPASASVLNMPTGIAVDSSGNAYIADSKNLRIRKIPSVASVGPSISTVAGNGVYSFSGDGGQANKAQMNLPHGVAVGVDGSVYVSDSANNVVRKIAVNGAISTIAGNGSAGFGGDAGNGPAAQLNAPEGVAVDGLGNVYIADSANNRVRKVASTGTITTFAGTGTAGSAGDNGPAASAQLNAPFGLALDAAGNLYVTEFGGNRVRKISATGAISTVAGNGVAGYAGDGSQAANAQLSGPKAVAADAAGINIYIADTNNNRVRLVTAGAISTVAGNGAGGYAGDLGLATAAQLGNPTGVAVDAAGNLYITDGSTRVRKVYPGGTIVTIADTNGIRGYLGDGGVAAAAWLNGPTGIAVSASGVLYVADSGNNAIRMLTPLSVTMSIGAVTNSASSLSGPISPGEVVVIYGSGLGPAQLTLGQLDTFGHLAKSLAGTTVLFNGTPGPVVYTWNTQVAAVVPYSVTGTSAQVVVQYLPPIPMIVVQDPRPGPVVPAPLVQDPGPITAPVTVSLAPAAPALYTLNYSGTGQAVAFNQDGSLNGAGNAVKIGNTITLYETGEGQTNPAGTDGLPGSATPPAPVLPVTVTIGGQPATVVSYGGIPGVVAGVMQVTAQVPSGVAPGNVAVVVTVGSAGTQPGVTIAVTQ